MKNHLVKKHSVVIGGHKTSVSLEEPFWDSMRAIAAERQETLSHLISTIDAGRQHGNLSSALRLFVLGFYQAQPKGDKRRRSQPPRLSQRPIHTR